MAVTNFYDFEVVFADADPRPAPPDLRPSLANTVYEVVEGPPGRWAVREGGEPVALADGEHDELTRLLAGLRPPPPADVEPPPAGCDGAWYTVDVHAGNETRGYRWWVNPPPEWGALYAVAEWVRERADAPRRARDEADRAVARRYFDRLAARDVAGMLACCAEGVAYSSPFLPGEARGADAAGRRWRGWFAALPDMAPKCDDVRFGFAYWQAAYTYPPTGRRVVQRFSADLRFENGRIVEHRDRFNVHEWAQAAYGPLGSVLGGNALFQRWALGQARACFGGAAV